MKNITAIIWLIALTNPTLSFEPARPNILWLIAEDFGNHLSCCGTKEVFTPHLDRLAAEGVRYRRFYAVAPVCSPSRSAFMTGMYHTTIGAHQHRSHRDDGYPLPEGVKLITHRMREAGYYTANVRHLPQECGFQGTAKTDWNFTPPDKPFDTDRWDYLAEHQPFFAQINFSETHRAFHAPKRADPGRVEVPPYEPDHPVTRADRASYLDAATELDRKIGLVLNQLRKEGLDKNTIIVFFGDNGQAHVRGKQFCYEEGVNVPLIIRWPQQSAGPVPFQPGTVSNQIIMSIDLAPTILDIAGVKQPTPMQGQAFLGPTAAPARTYAFAARDRCDETPFRLRAVCDQRYRYIRNFTPDKPFLQANNYKQKQYPVWNLLKELHAVGKLTPVQARLCAPAMPPEELYDLENDPHQIHDLIGQPEHQATHKRLRQVLEEWIVSTHDQGRIPESPDLIKSMGTTKPGTHPNSGYALPKSPEKRGTRP